MLIQTCYWTMDSPTGSQDRAGDIYCMLIETFYWTMDSGQPQDHKTEQDHRTGQETYTYSLIHFILLQSSNRITGHIAHPELYWAMYIQQDHRTEQETGILCMLIKTFYSTLDNHRITVQSRITGQDRRQVHAHKDIFWTMDSQQDPRTEQETCTCSLRHFIGL